MYCPKCGQLQVSEVTRFCSRCGFLLTEIAEVVANNGLLPQPKQKFLAPSSPRKKGAMQGLFIALTAFLFVPLIAAFSMIVRASPAATLLVLFLLVVGGLLRIAYALMFESAISSEPTIPQFAPTVAMPQLPESHSKSAADYVSPSVGLWRDTNELESVHSVTESTTKLLEKDEA